MVEAFFLDDTKYVVFELPHIFADNKYLMNCRNFDANNSSDARNAYHRKGHHENTWETS